MKMKKMILFLSGIFFALCFRFFVLEFYQVQSGQMAPTLLDKDYLMVEKYTYGLRIPFTNQYLWKWNEPQRGEVILFRFLDSYKIRRVIALPGDRLFYSKGVLFINEQPYNVFPPDQVKREWDFLKPDDFPGEDEMTHYVHWQEELSTGPYSILLEKKPQMSFGPYKIPKEHYFVMGDNRPRSKDSRTWPPHWKFAKGEVVFYRKEKTARPPVVIPKETLLQVQADAYFMMDFKTTQTAELTRTAVRVQVQAVYPGLNGNISKGALWRISGSLNDVLSVQNENDFLGGEDHSFVHSSLIYGRAWRVLWGCEKSLPFLKFLCYFGSFRQGRWFWPVHKK